MAKTGKHPKVKGQPIGTFHGFTVYARLDAAKKKGKDRVWFFIRPNTQKAWRLAVNLGWTRAVDVEFVNTPDGGD